MRVDLEVLKELINIDVPVEELANRLTMAGLEVSGVEEVLDSPVLEIEITSNRPDWLSILGIVREVAAIYNRKVSFPKVKVLYPNSADYDLQVEKGASIRYFGLRIDGVKVAPSPSWLANRLTRMGIRPINNVVDITNYVMLLFGQPLHAFDFDRLEGTRLCVRFARDGEKVVTLDGQKRVLCASDIVIADEKKVVALAGIMGAENSEVTEGTTRILLESAMFPRVPIRRTRQRLGISTEASYRFERGVNPIGVEQAVFYAVGLIESLCSGRLVGGMFFDEWQEEKRKVIFPISMLEERADVSVEKEECKRILSSLGFQVKSRSEVLEVIVPSFRPDITLPEDILEEVLRIYGYDKIPTCMPRIGDNHVRGKFSQWEKGIEWVKSVLSARGFEEAITFSLISKSDAELFYPKKNLLQVENTISSEYLFLRLSPLPGLVSGLVYNVSHGIRDVALYEVSQVLDRDNIHGPRYLLGAIALGKDLEEAFYRIKMIAEDLVGRSIQFRKGSSEVFSSFVKVFWEQQDLGFIGKLRNRIMEKKGLKGVAVYLELDLSKLIELRFNLVRQYIPPYTFPPIGRDVSMWVDLDKTNYQEIVSVIREAGGDLLREVNLIDVFEKDGRVSYAYHLVFAHPERTLSDEEVEPVMSRIIENLKNLAVELRI